MARIFLFFLCLIAPVQGWACDKQPCDLAKIEHFSFNENDLISWTPSNMIIDSYIDGKKIERKENTILFYFKPEKTKELIELAKKIADPINTENNLAIFFKDHLVSELRIPAPFPDFPEMNSFHLKVSDQDYQNLILILPQEKRVSDNTVPQ